MASQRLLCSCRSILRIADFDHSVPQVLQPAGMPADFKTICNYMQRPASDESCTDIAADRRESASVELTEARQSLLSKRRIADPGIRLFGERQEKAFPSLDQLAVIPGKLPDF